MAREITQRELRNDSGRDRAESFVVTRRSTTTGSVPMLIGRRTRTRRLVVDVARPPRGVIDTSVVIDLDRLDPSSLPFELAVTAITMAELAAGPHAAGTVVERAARQDRLQPTEWVLPRGTSP